MTARAGQLGKRPKTNEVVDQSASVLTVAQRLEAIERLGGRPWEYLRNDDGEIIGVIEDREPEPEPWPPLRGRGRHATPHPFARVVARHTQAEKREQVRLRDAAMAEAYARHSAHPTDRNRAVVLVRDEFMPAATTDAVRQRLRRFKCRV